MAYDTAAPVEDIEGIGPGTGAALRAAGVATVFDLLRHSSADLHAMVSTLASRAQAERWRWMAVLLPVTSGDPQLAEALVRANLRSVEAVALASFDELTAAFATAAANGTLPSVPAPAAVAAILTSAAVLNVTGHCAGEVLLPGGAPATGARASLGERSATVDAHGHFRLLAIPLDSRAPLRITLDGHRELVTPVELLREPTAVIAHAYALEAAVVGAPAPPAVEFSEFAGDELPDVPGAPVRTVRQTAAGLREGDVLLWRETLVRDPKERLVSRFLRFADGELLVDLYAIDTAALPPGAAVGVHLEVRGGALVEVPMNRRLLRTRILARRRRAAFAGWTGPPDAAGARALLDSLLAYSRANALNAGGA